jgi:hypothetical protein
MAATASFVPTRTANKGVRMLPTPNPAIEATAAAIIAATVDERIESHSSSSGTATVLPVIDNPNKQNDEDQSACLPSR